MFLDFFELKHALETRKYLTRAPEEFTSLYHQTFPSIRLGCTFRPESFKSWEQALESIDYLTNLGISYIRLGLRWSEVEQDRGILKLDNYKKIIEKALRHDLDICLNIGPIKSAGWPEQFIPAWVLETCPVTKGQCIHLSDDIATRGFEYVEKLLTVLKKEFGTGAFSSIQPENEGFKRFGTMQVVAGLDYLSKLTQIINFYFPKSSILLNSAGRMNVYKIFNFIRKYGRDSSFIVGYNYYFVTQASRKIYPWIRYLDDFVRVKFTTPPLSMTPLNTQFEVSECQFEKWGQAMWPGNNYEAFCYAIWRCGQVSNYLSQKDFVVRLWGVEKFIQKIMSNQLTSEHKKIMETIQLLSV